MKRVRRRFTRRCGALILAITGLASACSAAPVAEPGPGDPVPPLSFAFYSSDHSPTYEQSARVLADGFRQLGLDIQLEPIQFNTFVDQITVGDQLDDMALGSWGGDPDRTDPNLWLIDGSTCDGGRNSGHWCDPTYDEVARRQAAVLDEKQRQQLVFEAQARFQEALPWWQVSHETAGITYNADKWEGVVSPSPIPPHETVVYPWLQMKPKGDDRTLDWAHFEDLSTYNILSETASMGWLRFIYDPFIRFDDHGDLMPWAATSWRFVDDTTIELTLRDGMTFHDGRPVTADDAVFSINYLLKWEPPTSSFALEGMEGAEKVDDLTFRIRLSEPNAAVFRQALTFLVLLPKHIWEGIPESKGLANPGEWNPIPDGGVIGSGPFEFESWTRNQAHVLRANRDHWAAPHYDRLRRLSLGQADAVRAALVDGTADIATTVLPAATMQRIAEQSDHLKLLRSQTFNTTMLVVNHDKAPFDELAFRTALRLATDKERVAREGWLGFAEPAGPGNVPAPLEEWHNPNLEDIPFDIAKARQVLEDAGYRWDADGRLLLPDRGGS